MMRTLVLVAGSLLVGGGATAAVVTLAPVPQMAIHIDGFGGRDNRPGADSARIAMMLDALGKTDPLVCDLIGDQLGNFWTSGRTAGLGRLADAPATLQPAKDSLSGTITDPRAVKLLIANLAGDDPCVRRVSAKLLGRSNIAADRLAALLEDASPRVREGAALAAGEDERPELRIPLEKALSDRTPAVSVMAAWALGEIEDVASAPVLGKIARNGAGRLRIAAVWALGQIEDPSSVPDVVPALKDGDPTLRTVAAEALGQIESTASTSALIDALGDAVAAVRAAAADALGQVEDTKAVGALERLLDRDSDADVRRASAQALGQLESPSSARVLAKALSDADQSVREAAVEAIGNLDELHTAPPELVQALSSRNPEFRRQVAHALGHIADPGTTSALVGLLTDGDREVRLAAVEGLGEIGTSAVMPGLTRALDDKDPEIRRVAAEKLGDMKDR